MAAENQSELVNLVIDGKAVCVPKGTNVIEAAKTVGISIPHYCYHKHLSIAGNCRMCQVKVKGAPKLDIACNMQVKEGMEVSTHLTSQEVADAQAAVLEFILINHPLDCTVCDQSGHCKLQDYHFMYNARPSRFLEDKVHKAKAVPLGPTVMLDAERCIMCTRCIRFCDEVTGTSELGMINRGDRSEICIAEGRELNNPLSGTVVDLCPVGALTHRPWRFNTRIWYTAQNDSICPGCSTGCNVTVAVRDGQVVQVKGRLNSAVNKQWMCDEGRYGFDRFLPASRLTTPLLAGKECAWDKAVDVALQGLKSGDTLVLLSPDLPLEEYWLIRKFLETFVKPHSAAVAYRRRSLTKVQQILISPDYACNYRSAEFSGLVYGDLEAAYLAALDRIRNGAIKNLLLVGDRALAGKDCDEALMKGVMQAECSVATLSDAAHPLRQAAKVIFPGRSILEKSGLLINSRDRLQYAGRVIDAPAGSEQEWRIINRLAAAAGAPLSTAAGDRELTLELLSAEKRLGNLTIGAVRAGGVQVEF